MQFARVQVIVEDVDETAAWPPRAAGNLDENDVRGIAHPQAAPDRDEAVDDHGGQEGGAGQQKGSPPRLRRLITAAP